MNNNSENEDNNINNNDSNNQDNQNNLENNYNNNDEEEFLNKIIKIRIDNFLEEEEKLFLANGENLKIIFKILCEKNNNQIEENDIIEFRETTLTLVTLICNLLKNDIESFIPVLDEFYSTIIFMLKELYLSSINSTSSVASSSSSSSLSIHNTSGGGKKSNSFYKSPTSDSEDDSSFLSTQRNVISPIINRIKKSENIRLSTNNTQSNNPRQQLYNIISVTMLGTVCLLFPSNEKLLSKSIPFLFEIGHYKSQTQSLIISTISSEIINRPKILSNYVLEFIKFSKDNPNVFSIIASLYQYNKQDFEKNLNVLIECFKEPESRIGILSIISEISKVSPLIIIPYLKVLKLSLSQVSLSSQFSIILKILAQKYPFTISTISSDLISAMDNNDSLKYSLPEILGMCGPDKTKLVYQYLYSLLKKQQEKAPRSSEDDHIVVSILKGFKSIYKTSPNLINIRDPLLQYFSTNGSEFILSFLNTLVDEFTLSPQQIDDMEQQQQQLQLHNNNNYTTTRKI
ncbi:hypothetical protein DICPUDRAFT_157900 [Dictyostelium purpureum]|uniref:Uncharacterized protein n=1 Tax=Dictyostelium purpureum TaxID=5786 RepID=F1A0A8_DICPU|nr:uncharacterized protein DICPUDRAFT_157900 [Dictyostelium purpureum]EGC30363.1 hypothetical protein DICPUDRAFT_157900 [Dictyostelium purpureum]|eukprot:XP_003293105.1 hypothetical protein DICPUDRAFT_157900 [Dictyostelium purpureum]